MRGLQRMQAARNGGDDGEREGLKAQMLVLHLRTRIQKELSMQVHDTSIREHVPRRAVHVYVFVA